MKASKASGSFLKKRTKKLSFTAWCGDGGAKSPRQSKFFLRLFYSQKRFAFLTLLAFLAASPAAAQDDTAAAPIVTQPAGTILVPDHFLRRWDPVTVFFDHDVGAAAGTPDDAPDKLVTVSPPQPGAWTWLSPRTLQFRPAAPWPPLSSFDWRVQGAPDVQLSRLLDPTVQTDPANGAAVPRPLSALSLTFSEPLDVTKLPGMLDIAISPLPGLDAAQAQHLTPADFDIKSVERTAPGDNATYIVQLHKPVPDGMRVDVAIGLSPIPGLAGTVEHLSFTTAAPFRPTMLGCADQRVPLSAAGTIYDRVSALNCASAATPDQSNGDQSSADQDGSQDNSQDSSQDSGADNSQDMSQDNSPDNNDQSTDNTQAGGSTPDLTAPSTALLGAMPVTTAKTPSVGAPDQTPAAAATADAPRQIVVEFSADPAPIDPITARNFVRITPAVDGVTTAIAGGELDLTANFKTGTLYQVTLEPGKLMDVNGRAMAMAGPSTVWLYWPPEADALALAAGNGVMERAGPQMVPLTGRGYAQADLRIHQVDPLDRSFWPFPPAPIATNDNDRPAAPGEQPIPWNNSDPIGAADLQAQIGRLGSPATSTLVNLPLTPHGPSAAFGLDLTAQLAAIAGRHDPGTYLVGIRALDAPGNRSWMRVQVTDLSLTTVEEESTVRFYVTSLATGMPVAGAKIEVDGVVDGSFAALDSGTTGPDGGYTWQVANDDNEAAPTRIVVTKDDDTLVIDPNQPPDRYTANGWATQPDSNNAWLAWTAAKDFSDRHPKPQTLCHVFTERPIYRPEDPVHVKTYIRTLTDGVLTAGGQGHDDVELVITGPDTTTNWTAKLQPDANGDAHYLFNDKTTATGQYQAEIDINGNACADANFTKDAYRLPRFLVRMDGPDSIPLDKPATVAMTAIYYAGGPAAGRPVRFRVTEFPYGFSPAARPGFVYATDSMFQTDDSFQASAATERDATTDAQGRATITVDPTLEASNAPRRYVVEATVTGDDDKTVTNTQDVLALPSFVLGLQAPRFLPQANAIALQYLMVNAAGKPIAGRPITLRLLRRQWSSILQASDFSDGKAKYQTEVVDEKLLERTITSGTDATRISLPIDRAGVYIVQLEAADALGRLQTVSLDLFAGGANGVTWSRPPATTFQVTTDKPAYVPGDTAKLILQSPFQTARALAIAELPGGQNTYQWLDVKNGYAVYSLPITPDFMPRIPVHFVLMRGRLPGDDAVAGLDLRRPETIAATAWIGVTPVKNIVTASVSAPAQALPGATVQLTVKLADDAGKPISGTVTLWLIDQAVLALAPEAPLDPLPDFIRDRGSRVAVSDTRNWPFGDLPLDENPGGEAPAPALAPRAPSMDLLDKVTVRKNFNPMPYYNPALVIGPSGTATVTIKLPDDLTNFKIRAIADAGPERFGFATGQIAIRLPVIVEPNLPRFVRPGDSLSLAGLGRITEGPGGPGAAQLAVDGLTVTGPLTQTFNWQPGTSQPFSFPATVENPGYDKNGNPVRTSVSVTLGVTRDSDKASDAFQVNLPIQPDRDPVHERQLTDLTSATPLDLPAIASAARPGTIRRQILVSSQPELVRLFAGLDYLRDYPFGCTEQRVSLARAEIAAKYFSAAMDQAGAARTTADVNQTLAWIANATDPTGLVAFWPGDRGDVTLTAWSLEFLVEARNAGFTIDPVEQATLVHALQQSLRSDYPNFVSGGAYVERAWALAALAYDGHLDRDYADELARQHDQLTLEGIAQVSLSLQQDKTNAPALAPLQQALWTGIVIKLRDGKPVYAGLQEGSDASTDYPDIFPSETRTLAEMLRATAASTDKRRKLIVDALVTLGNGDGWGSTNADAEAFLALTAYLKSNTGTPPQSVTLAPAGATPQKIALSGTQPLQRIISIDGAAVKITAAQASAKNAVSVQSDLSWLPVQDGSQVAATANGFVVTSEADKIDLSGGPASKTLLDRAGITLTDKIGDVIEEHLQVVNPEDRNYVAITVPLAAGMEPLDPALATAPPEAKPSFPPTLNPSYTAFLDDKVTYFYDSLPAGTYDFYFRTKAAVPGRFIQPAAQAIMMYNDAITGNGPGAIVQIAAAK
jgi:uncharacterized protein YfaS (alpha-2-macroglobulin family)